MCATELPESNVHDTNINTGSSYIQKCIIYQTVGIVTYGIYGIPFLVYVIDVVFVVVCQQ